MADSFAIFESHLEDLRRIFPDAGEVFVCPICLKVIRRDNFTKETINQGHVWPKLIRSNLDSKDGCARRA